VAFPKEHPIKVYVISSGQGTAIIFHSISFLLYVLNIDVLIRKHLKIKNELADGM
jgi:hypothetical protein